MPTKEKRPITRPFKPPTPISFPTKVIFCFAVRRSSIKTRMVTARDCVPTLPDISRIRDWKAMIMVSCATTVSKRPTTVDTTRPRKSSKTSQTSVVFSHFIIVNFQNVLCRDDTEDNAVFS